MIRPQSYQYFAKLTILPVILAWAITIVACIVVGESRFLAVCFTHPPPPTSAQRVEFFNIGSGIGQNTGYRVGFGLKYRVSGGVRVPELPATR